MISGAMMNKVAHVLLALALPVVALGCDEKKPEATATAPSAPPAPTVTASAPATAEPTASAAPSAAASSGSSMITGDAKDVVLTVKDPTKEPEKTVKVQAGGSLTLFLPDYPGTVWSVDTFDKALGKAKEEVIPGFAPGTNGHQFKWTPPATLKGQKQKAQLVNKKLGDKAAKPSGTFALTLDLG